MLCVLLKLKYKAEESSKTPFLQNRLCSMIENVLNKQKAKSPDAAQNNQGLKCTDDCSFSSLPGEGSIPPTRSCPAVHHQSLSSLCSNGGTVPARGKSVPDALDVSELGRKSSWEVLIFLC